MNKYVTYGVIAVAAAIVIAAVLYYQGQQGPMSSPTPSSSGTVCTLEVKLCADGSYVGRVGPHCDFAPCPTPKPAATSGY